MLMAFSGGWLVALELASLRFLLVGRTPSSRPLGGLSPVVDQAIRRAKARGGSSVASRGRLRLGVGFLEAGAVKTEFVVLDLETGRGAARVVGGRSEVCLFSDLSRLCLWGMVGRDCGDVLYLIFAGLEVEGQGYIFCESR